GGGPEGPRPGRTGRHQGGAELRPRAAEAASRSPVEGGRSEDPAGEPGLPPGPGRGGTAVTQPPGDRIDPAEIREHYRRGRGLLGIQSKIPVRDEYILSLVYTPGVAEPCLAIRDDPESSFIYTMRGNTVAILSDGSSVLSYGDAGASAALAVMEGKALLFKTLAGLGALPLCSTARGP